MASLVTLGSAGYNPYNDTFARFAMQGLQMGIQQQQFNAQMAQQDRAMTSRVISEGVQNTFDGIKINMQREEMAHRQQNDAFNNTLKLEQFQFEKDTYGDRLALDQGRAQMEREKFDYLKQQDAEVDNPYKTQLTAKLKSDLALDLLSQPSQLEAAKLTSEKMALANESANISLTPYREDPGLAQREKEAEIRSREADAAYKTRATRYGRDGNMTYSEALMRKNQLVNQLNNLREDQGKVGSDITITDKMPPNLKKEYETRNATNRKKVEELQDLVDTTIEELSFVTELARSKREGQPTQLPSGPSVSPTTNAPASTQSAVPPPGMGPAAQAAWEVQHGTPPAKATPGVKPPGVNPFKR